MEKNDKNISKDWFDNLESNTPPTTDLEKIKEYLFYTAQWYDPNDPYYISKDYLKQTIEFLNKLTPYFN
jgi:hypothetical protein